MSSLSCSTWVRTDSASTAIPTVMSAKGQTSVIQSIRQVGVGGRTRATWSLEG